MSSPAKLRTVLVGTAHWARAHAAALQQCPETELIAVAGHRDRERLEAFAAEFRVPGSLDLRALLRAEKPDILDLACHASFRLEGIRLAQACGVTAVTVEKPLALTWAEAQEIEQFCREHRIKLTVNHQKKFMPGWRDAEAALAAGDLGRPKLLWASCQGNVLEQGTHLIDMALFLNQYSQPCWIFGQVADPAGFRKEKVPAPDAALCDVELQNGCRCVFEIGTVGRRFRAETGKWSQFGIDLEAERGYLQVTLNQGFTLRRFDTGAVRNLDTSWSRDYPGALQQHFATLAAYVRGQTEKHPSDLDHSMLSFRIIAGLYESALTRTRVPLDRPPRLGMEAELQAAMTAAAPLG